MSAKFVIAGFFIVLMAGSILASEKVNLPSIGKVSRLFLAEKQQDYIVPRIESRVSPSPTPSYADCGVANDESSKVYGGEEMAANEFPWQALLLVLMKNGTTSFCGGSLIAERWILTSASCLQLPTGKELDRVNVYLGVREVPSVNQKTYWSNETFIHPDWNSTTQAGNIALLKLSTAVEYTQYIRPICLASSSEPDYINQQVTVAGINRATAGHSPTDSATGIFHKIAVPVVSNSECNAIYNSLITNQMMCTGGVADSGICMSDKGDPMIFKQTNGAYKQLGIISFAPPDSLCQFAGTPSAYTKLSSYSSWVENVTQLSPSSSPSQTSHPAPYALLLLVAFLILSMN